MENITEAAKKEPKDAKKKRESPCVILQLKLPPLPFASNSREWPNSLHRDEHRHGHGGGNTDVVGLKVMRVGIWSERHAVPNQRVRVKSSPGWASVQTTGPAPEGGDGAARR